MNLDEKIDAAFERFFDLRFKEGTPKAFKKVVLELMEDKVNNPPTRISESTPFIIGKTKAIDLETPQILKDLDEAIKIIKGPAC